MTTLLGRFNRPLLTLKSTLGSPSSSKLPSSSPSSLIHTSAALSGSWGGGKLKTHSGTAKRFAQVGRKRSTRVYDHPTYSEDGVLLGLGYTKVKISDVMYKRGRTGKQHLNSKMHHSREARLRGTKLEEGGHTIRTLNRLIGSHY